MFDDDKSFLAFWFIAVLLCIAFWATVIIVGIHFIGKFW